MITAAKKSAMSPSHKPPRWVRVGAQVLACYAIAQLLCMGVLALNHIGFPLNLEAMELTVLQHVKRLMAGLPLYPAPSSDFIALAYNPLFYYLCLPFTWILGPSLFTLRFVALLGLLGCYGVLYSILYRQTQSRWWALMGIGLFAAAYRTMDSYLDTAHRESWLLLSLLSGCFVLEQSRSRWRNCLGLGLVILSFWIKQQGSVFVIGALLYLLWREPWKQSWLYVGLAIGLGPILYQWMPDSILGPSFHYYTWQVPRQWVEFIPWELLNLYYRTMRAFGVLILACISGLLLIPRMASYPKQTLTLTIWDFMLPFACAGGLLAALTPGSNYNVWIPMWTWFILVGILGLKRISTQYPLWKQWGGSIVVLALSFSLLLYNPFAALVAPQAQSTYQAFTTFLGSLNGPVFAPDIGQLASGYQFSPGLMRVPLEDIVRGPGVNEHNHPTVRRILQPVLQPSQPAFLLLNHPLSEDPLLDMLTQTYTLQQDLGDRFKPLKTLPRRYDMGWPRYLYQFQGSTNIPTVERPSPVNQE
ncbi:MAG TPA: hypothetical protein V6D19_21510 [Stenomitos sp.]